MPLNLVDPQSGTDYFTAATALVKQLEALGVADGSVDISKITPIPYYENLFPDAVNAAAAWEERPVCGTDGHAGHGHRVRNWYPTISPPCSTTTCTATPACTRVRAVLVPEQSVRLRWRRMSTIGRSAYNALQLTLRKRYSKGYQFDLNYTFGYAKDHSSRIERNSNFTGPVDFGLAATPGS